ncbi:hypothetical protein C6V83_15640 [Gordonia iterans]|uniref:Uncharacterized protein n=1 Tax=Gordonia iterans TaxID=1004901 RepID=A0A2S0KIF5_9ACTN|nr:hypothetical protein [Gordonia iterans]AVM01459.1 hypothetical protein C6V83_15640 [Gordonia iterans]
MTVIDYLLRSLRLGRAPTPKVIRLPHKGFARLIRQRIPQHRRVILTGLDEPQRRAKDPHLLHLMFITVPSDVILFAAA